MPIPARFQDLFDSLLAHRRPSARRASFRTAWPNHAEVLERRTLLTTFLVDAAGNGDFTTIQAAIDAATNNGEADTINIAAGTYLENIEIGVQEDALMLVGLGSDRSDVVIDGSGAATPTDTVTIHMTPRRIIELSTLTVIGGRDGLHIQRDPDATLSGTVQATNISVRDNQLSGVAALDAGRFVARNSEFINNGGRGIYAQDTSSISVTASNVSGNSLDGIDIRNASDLRLVDSEVNNNQSEGLFASNVEIIDIRNSTFNENLDNGVDIRSAGRLLVRDSEVRANGPLPGGERVSGFFVRDINIVEAYSLSVTDNTANGLDIFNLNDFATVDDLTASGNAFSGLRFVQDTEATMTNNAEVVVKNTLAQSNAGRGLDFRNVSRVSVFDSSSLENGDVENDELYSGAGIYISGGNDIDIVRSQISNNITDVAGGGIIVREDANVTISQSEVSGNVSTRGGGGFWIDRGSVVLIDNSTISGNSADGVGGGIGNQGEVSIRNSTIVLNTAAADSSMTEVGGGVWTEQDSFAITRLNNSIVAGNQLGDGSPNDLDHASVDASSSSNLIGDASTSGGLVDGNNNNQVGMNGTGTRDVNTVIDPTLADNGGPTRTHLLVENSPAIDAGSNLLIPNGSDVDQRGDGFLRIINYRVDIGAVESPFEGVMAEVDELGRLESSLISPGAINGSYTRQVVGRFGNSTSFTGLDNRSDDLFYWNPETGQNRFLLADGRVFTNLINPTAINSDYTEFVVGNFDGEGVDDIFFWNPATGGQSIGISG